MSAYLSKLFAIFLVGTCALLAHGQQWTDYKCHVVDTEGAHWVHLFELDEKDVSSARVTLLDRLILDGHGTPIATIEEVKECRPLDAPFASSVARRIDASTPK